MYNAKIKEEFIDMAAPDSKTAARARRIFEEISQVEEYLGKDLCEMNADEAQLALGKSTQTARLWMPAITMLRRYVARCADEKGLDTARGVYEARDVNVVDVLENMVSDPGGLQSLLDRLFYPERELRIDCIYRCYYWLAFAGLKLDDVFKINVADVDLESMVVHFEDEEYPIYKEALPAFKNASTLNAFNAYSTWFTEVKSWNRVVGLQLLRGLRGMARKETFRNQLNKFLEARAKAESRPTDNAPTYDRVQKSGLFYRVHVYESATDERESFQRFADLDMADKTFKLHRGQSLEKRRDHKARMLRADYDKWRYAFYGEGVMAETEE